MKYAVVETGGKQYIAREGEMIEVDRLPLEIGKPVEFNEVLLIVDEKAVQVGDPLVKGASVKGEVLDQVKAKKVIVFKYIPKERYRRKQGHRQRYTQVRISEIVAGGAKKAAVAKAEEPPQAESKPAKPAAKKAEAAPKATSKPAAKSGAAAKPKSGSKAAPKPKSGSQATPKSKSSSSSKPTGSKSSSSTSRKSPSKKTSTKKDE
jgi:large subunit ribosomal protein L21